MNWPLIPLDTESLKRAENLVGEVPLRTLDVRVFDPKDVHAALVAREQEIVERRASSADVQAAGGRGGESHADGHEGADLIRSRPMSAAPERSSWKADLALAGITLIWGSTFIVNAKVIGREPPIEYLAVRFTVAALVLLLASSRQARTRSIVGDGAFIGIVLTLGMAFQIAGQTETTASKTAFITGLSVVLTPFLAIFRTRRGPGVANLLGVLLATAGFFLLSWPAGGQRVNRGDLMVLVCAALFAIYIVENAERAPRHPTLKFTAFQLTAAAAALWILSFWLKFGRPGLALVAFEARPIVFDGPFVAAISYMIVFATLITFIVTTWAQTKMSATHTAVIYALEPFWTAIFAAIILSERLGANGLAGGALVIAGIVVSELRFSPAET